ncbi:MAG: hypothetical protein CENE_02905 [Candidatus Celerinatantimonas neptuna]|nr:MAG: hypothetical protein CENE_02905 [Candidatus Celerinatantimonas neptuna]
MLDIKVGELTEQIQAAQNIRQEVFCKEQSIPCELDQDGLDNQSLHFLVYDDIKAIGTARLTIQGHQAILARVAILENWRGRGIASRVIRAALESAKQNKQIGKILVHAHCYLQSYYEKFGFQYIRDCEIVGEHPLVEMQLVVKRPIS